MYDVDALSNQVVGKYRVEDKIGEGGMAIVYKAFHTEFNEPVAIKVLTPNHVEEMDVQERFKREAKIQFKLRHPNLVRVHDLIDDNGLLGMAMDWIPGRDLEELMNDLDRPLTLAEIQRLFLPVLDVLNYAHQNKVIHRDLKPSNILLDGIEGNEVPKVTDFGIAKSLDEDGSKTKTGVILGTPYYLPPELCLGKEVDHRADIYSLGIMLYQMLTGKLPFVGDNPFTIIVAHSTQELPALTSETTPIDPRIEKIVQKATAKNPNNRYPNCGAFAEELNTVISGLLGQGIGYLEDDESTASGVIPPGLLDAEGADTIAMTQEDLAKEVQRQQSKPGKVPEPEQYVNKAPILPTGSFEGDDIEEYVQGTQQDNAAPAARSGASNAISQPMEPIPNTAGPNHTQNALLGAIVVLLGIIAFLVYDKSNPASKQQPGGGLLVAKMGNQNAKTKVNNPQAREIKKRVAPAPTRRAKVEPTPLRRTKPRIRMSYSRKRVASAYYKRRNKLQQKLIPRGKRLTCKQCVSAAYNTLFTTPAPYIPQQYLGMCNHGDFIMVGKQCARFCRRNYLTFCKAYMYQKFKTQDNPDSIAAGTLPVCRNFVLQEKSLSQLRRFYKGSATRRNAKKCTSGW